MHFKYLDNIKPLVKKPNAAFILMGLSSTILLSDGPRVSQFAIAEAHAEVKNIEPELSAPSPLVTVKNKDRFHKVGNFQLPQDIKPNNISKHIARVQLEKKEYFLALASQAEGYRSNIYKDNQGWALGNGWNLTKQSPEYNKELAQAVFRDKKTVHTLTHMSAKSDVSVSSKQIQSVEMPPQKALQVTYLIGEKIKKDYVIPGISQVIQKDQKIEKDMADTIAHKVFTNLKKNEQDTLIYHAYKCGGYSFVKFNNLIKKVIDYSLKKKHVSKESIIAEFNYSYKLDGKKYLDKQSQELVGAMFLGPQDFAKVTNIKLLNFDEPMQGKIPSADEKIKTIRLAHRVDKSDKSQRKIVIANKKANSAKVALYKAKKLT